MSCSKAVTKQPSLNPVPFPQNKIIILLIHIPPNPNYAKLTTVMKQNFTALLLKV